MPISVMTVVRRGQSSAVVSKSCKGDEDCRKGETCSYGSDISTMEMECVFGLEGNGIKKEDDDGGDDDDDEEKKARLERDGREITEMQTGLGNSGLCQVAGSFVPVLC
jgi:hypothetical protein